MIIEGEMLRSISKLLVVGLDVTSLAISANRAGYEVYSVDYFGDSDLANVCSLSLSVTEQKRGISCGRIGFDFDIKDLLVLSKKLVEECEVDGILLSSGLEDYPRILSALSELAPIIGNNPKTIRRVREKEFFFAELDRIGVPHPRTEFAESLEEAKKKALDLGYPVVVKPERGFGGYGLRKATSPKRLEAVFRFNPPADRFLIQEYIEGKAASASVISTMEDARTLTVNEQLLGRRSLGQSETFGYCGNIVPLEISKSVVELCKKTSEKVVRHFHLLGSNGVDFIIDKRGFPKIVEVNPRFQGTLECVERVQGINVVKSHIEACTLRALPNLEEARSFCVRLILYALKRLQVPALNIFDGIRNVPFEGVIIEKGEPFCSVLMEGNSRIGALQKAEELANSIYCSI